MASADETKNSGQGTVVSLPAGSWRSHLRNGASRFKHLEERGLATGLSRNEQEAVEDRFQMFVSDYYLGLIDPNDPDCPIRKQAIPDVAELLELGYEEGDPIGDGTHGVNPILVHRYGQRALLFPTLRCPMFCRYCFRKAAINGDPLRFRTYFEEALSYLQNTPQIREVILSGGDPLILSNRALEDILTRVRDISHIKLLRIHSRFPVTLPMRVDDALVAVLAAVRPLHLVTHFNHPNEITPEARTALKALADAGITVLNQAVLLKGVNDSVEVQVSLWQQLAEQQVVGYYLHHLDAAPGTHHFRVSLEDGLALFNAFRGQLSGIERPQYVMEIPGGGGKVPIDSHLVRKGAQANEWVLTSPITGRSTLWHDPIFLSDDGGLNIVD